MFEEGLLDEVARLLAAPDPLSRTARQALGYQEAIDHLEGRLSLAETIERIQTRTRQFAKRQHTWFRHLEECRAVEITGDETPAELADRLSRLTPIATERVIGRNTVIRPPTRRTEPRSDSPRRALSPGQAARRLSETGRETNVFPNRLPRTGPTSRSSFWRRGKTNSEHASHLPPSASTSGRISLKAPGSKRIAAPADRASSGGTRNRAIAPGETYRPRSSTKPQRWPSSSISTPSSAFTSRTVVDNRSTSASRRCAGLRTRTGRSTASNLQGRAANTALDGLPNQRRRRCTGDRERPQLAEMLAERPLIRRCRLKGALGSGIA